MNLSNEELQRVLANSDCLISRQEIEFTYNRLAEQLNLHYAGLNPLILVVLNGGLIPAGQLLTRLNFFHRVGYLHATRYRNNSGGGLEWRAPPSVPVRDEHVLLIDDIFDEGITIRAVAQELEKQHPASLKTAVLLNKLHDRKVRDFCPDFVGREVVDRYIYGCGMDYHGYFRHLAGIYALKE